MYNYKNLSALTFITTFLSAVIAMTIMGFLWIYNMKSGMERDLEQLKANYVNSQKELIKAEVESIKGFVQQEKIKAEQQMSKILNTELNIAHAALLRLNDDLSETALLRDLADISDTDYFIINSSEKFIVNTRMPETEGRPASSYKDSLMRAPFVEAAAIANINNIASLSFRPTGAKGDIVIYARKIGSTGYVLGVFSEKEKFLSDAKERIFSALAAVKLTQGGYFFAGDANGYMHVLFNKRTDPPLYYEKFKDANGLLIFQEMKKVAMTAGSGYFTYFYPKEKGGKPLQKISYTVGDTDLNIMYGTGLYIGDIEDIVEHREKEITSELNKSIAFIALILLILSAAAVATAKIFSIKIKQGFGSFMLFFERSRDENIKILNDELYFTEFKILAEYANRMVEERISFEKEIKEKQATLAKEIEEKLDAQIKLETIVSTMKEGVLLQDSTGRILSVNQSLLNMLETDELKSGSFMPDEIRQKMINEKGENCEPSKFAINQCRVSGQPVENFTVGYKSLNGSIKWLTVNVVPILSQSGNVMRTVATFNDITVRKNLNDELEKTRLSLENAQEIANIGNWEWKPDSRKIWLSKMFYSIHGMKETEEPTLESFLSIVSDEDRGRLKRMLEELANKEIPFETDYTVVTPAGLQKTIFAKGLPDKDKNGESIINGTVQDVTGIRKAQSELKEAYSKLNKYIEIIDDNVIVSETDRDGYITTVSDAFCHISGYGRNELIGKHFTFLLDGNRDDALLAKVESMLDNGQTWSGEIRHKRKDGKFYWAMVTVSPRYNASGKMEGIIAIRQDITDKKRVEELSVTDELTGLFNRRHFNNIIKNELNRAKREKNMMTFAILDVDRFKQYNDTYGHLMGDQVLQKIAASMLNRANRASDYLFRLGGEEFGIIFSGADEVQTADFLENIRKDIIDLKIPHEKNDAFRFVTISAGAVCIDFRSGIAPGIEAIYRMADEELYKSKKAGRNKTHVKIIN